LTSDALEIIVTLKFSVEENIPLSNNSREANANNINSSNNSNQPQNQNSNQPLSQSQKMGTNKESVNEVESKKRRK